MRCRFDQRHYLHFGVIHRSLLRVRGFSYLDGLGGDGFCSKHLHVWYVLILGGNMTVVELGMQWTSRVALYSRSLRFWRLVPLPMLMLLQLLVMKSVSVVFRLGNM